MTVVAHEHVLDLGGGDVLAAADDRVVGPPLDEEVALAVDPTPVTGREPALVVDHRALVVLAGDLLTPQEHQPDLADRQRLVELVADLDLDAGQHLARPNRAGPWPPGRRRRRRRGRRGRAGRWSTRSR